MRRKVVVLIISIVLLVLGLLLYLLLNREAFVSRILLKIIPIQIEFSENIGTKILRGYGADFLWSVSFTMIIHLIIWTEKKSLGFLLFCSLLGILYEIMQCFGITTGTADIVDVIVYILGSLFAILIIQGGKLYEEKSDVSINIGN